VQAGGFEYVLNNLSLAIEALQRPPTSTVATWFLGWVFLWSGIVKIRQPMQAAVAIVDFRVSRHLRSWAGTALGILELAIAGLLFLISGARGSVALAAILLGMFTLVIARSVRSGATFPCFCFGDSRSRVSMFTLLRTAALAGVALILSFSTNLGLTGSPQDLSLQFILSGAVLAVAVLASRIRRLLRWNRDVPFLVEPVLARREADAK
jgi:uncharacterized membrane protein YphA (DoxX/SURF4 family)